MFIDTYVHTYIYIYMNLGCVTGSRACSLGPSVSAMSSRCVLPNMAHASQSRPNMAHVRQSRRVWHI